MKLIIDGKEEEINTELEKGTKELDMLTPNSNNEEELEDTIEITEEELKSIKEKMENAS